MDNHLSKAKLSKALFQSSYLTGQFTLRSGQTSTQYFDKYRFESDPRLLWNIAFHSLSLLPKSTEVLAGLELGGVPIATAISLQSQLPAAFVRKEAKTYGTCQIAEGASLKGKKVLIIEDVITTGGQVLLSAEDLRKAGADLVGVFCVILRDPQGEKKLNEAGLKLTSLFTMEELLLHKA